MHEEASHQLHMPSWLPRCFVLAHVARIVRNFKQQLIRKERAQSVIGDLKPSSDKVSSQFIQRHLPITLDA